MDNISKIKFPTVLMILAVTLLAGSGYAQEASDIQQVDHCYEPACACDIGCCDPCNSGACDNDYCGDCCRKCCVATVEKEKIEKHCWKLEPKEICVPKVVLPWQEGGSGLTIFNCLKKCSKSNCCGEIDCCDSCSGDSCCCMKPRCGKVITVCDLKKEKYEVEECVCKWSIRRLPPCCDNGCRGCCDGGCCDSCCDPSCGAKADHATNDIQLTGLHSVQNESE